MPAILLTGMSAVGKSTILGHLGARGFAVLDTDRDGYGTETSPGGGPVELLWVEDRIEEVLTRSDQRRGEVLFLGGCAANQVGFYPRFAAIVLLSAPVEVVLERLGTRTTNDFGKSAEDRARILADLIAVEPRLRRAADVEIDTRQPLGDVVDRLVRLAEDVVRGTDRGGWSQNGVRELPVAGARGVDQRTP